MAGTMERVFPLGSSLEHLQEYSKKIFAPLPTALIIGPPYTCKTAMLLQAAVTECARGGHVIFITPGQFCSPPPSVHGMTQATPCNMENMKFLYATDATEVRAYMASLHKKSREDLPTLIVIDDLHKYIPKNDSCDVTQMMVNVATMFALIQDAGGFCNNFHEENQYFTTTGIRNHHCSLLMSWTSYSTDLLKLPEIEGLVKDYCHYVWSMKKLSEKKETASSDYQMMTELNDASCNITFGARFIGTSEQDIVLYQVELQRKDENTQGTTQR